MWIKWGNIDQQFDQVWHLHKGGEELKTACGKNIPDKLTVGQIMKRSVNVKLTGRIKKPEGRVCKSCEKKV